jgi:hypothetical protein
VQPFPNLRLPTLVLSGAGPIDLDLLIEAAPAITKLVSARRNTLETMLTRLMRHGFQGGGRPTDQQYARAIQREVEIVRDHFAATRGGVERRVRALLPILSYLKGLEVAHRLSERHDRLGPLLKLREWLAEEMGEELAGRLWAAVEVAEDQAQLRRDLGFDFAPYNAILSELGYPLLNDEEDFRRLFEVYLMRQIFRQIFAGPIDRPVPAPNPVDQPRTQLDGSARSGVRRAISACRRFSRASRSTKSRSVSASSKASRRRV